MSYIKWDIRSQDKFHVKTLSKGLSCSETVSRLLINRGLTSVESADEFLNPAPSCIHNPYLLTDMDKAVAVIKKNIIENKKICVYGDYDVDGITSVSSLYLYIKKFTDNVIYFIPDRFSQGYGVNKGAIDRIKQKDCSLIVTVDTGISAVEEIEYAKQLGIDVVVTDHHECQDALPPADAVVNPKRADDFYPFPYLAGVGVVYKLISAIDIEMGTEYSDEFIDLVAIGTIADIMPLLDENRYIVKLGMEKILSTPNKGLKCLIDMCATNQPLSSSSVGFMIAPRINAAGRMDDAEKAVELFTTNDFEKAGHIAERLCQLNYERQKIENEIFQQAVQIIEEQDLNSKYSVLVLWKQGWHSGVIGIVASKLKEKYNKPAILFSVDEVSKGSGRSVAPFNLYEAFEQNKDMLIQYGGHKYAAGVLLENDRLHQFRDKISECLDSFLENNRLCDELSVECTLNHSDVTYKTVSELSLLQPFGKNNEVPLFCLRKVRISDLFPISNNRHLRIKLTIGDKLITAYYFSVDMSRFDYREGDLVDIVCELNENEYKNFKSVQLVIRDLRYSKEQIDSYNSRRINCDEKKSVMISHLPNRADIAVVYRFFHQAIQSGRHNYNLDTVCNVINKDCLVNLNYEKVYYSIKILVELGIIVASFDDNEMYIYEIVDSKRFSLSDSTLLMSIYKKAGVEFGN